VCPPAGMRTVALYSVSGMARCSESISINFKLKSAGQGVDTRPRTAKQQHTETAVAAHNSSAHIGPKGHRLGWRSRLLFRHFTCDLEACYFVTMLQRCCKGSGCCCVECESVYVCTERTWERTQICTKGVAYWAGSPDTLSALGSSYMSVNISPESSAFKVMMSLLPAAGEEEGRCWHGRYQAQQPVAASLASHSSQPQNCHSPRACTGL
jgi:hypothetical protein